MSTGPLAGYTIGITAARRREEFAAALERRGAAVICAPAIRMVPLADDGELREATLRCLRDPPGIVVATTGIGFRGWVEAADAWGIGGELVKAIGHADILARGPKARGAVRAAGLRETWSPESESTGEILDYLTARDLDGTRVAVQLHGEPLPGLVKTLRQAGADVVELPVYRSAPPQDPAALVRLIAAVCAAAVDAVAFTSAPAAASFLRTAGEHGYGGAVRAALTGPAVAACVGPVAARPLQQAGIPVLQPGRARLGALVREITEQVPARRGITVLAAGRLLEVRGHAVVADGRLIRLTAASMALLRKLAARPGDVVSRAELRAVTPGEGGEHAVEMAVGRLRTVLGDPRIVVTVPRRGYRLACEPDRPAGRDGG